MLASQVFTKRGQNGPHSETLFYYIFYTIPLTIANISFLNHGHSKWTNKICLDILQPFESNSENSPTPHTKNQFRALNNTYLSGGHIIVLYGVAKFSIQKKFRIIQK